MQTVEANTRSNRASYCPSYEMNTTGQERSQERTRMGLLLQEPIRLVGLCAVLDGVPWIEAVPVGLREGVEDKSLALLLLCMVDRMEAFRQLREIRTRRPELKVIAMCAETSEETMIRAISAGAKGFLGESASPDQLMQCIEVVMSGSIWAPRKVLAHVVEQALSVRGDTYPPTRPPLTQREQEVVRLLAAARSNREIAKKLGIEERTVKAHMAKLMRKAGVENRTALTMQLARWAHKGPTG